MTIDHENFRLEVAALLVKYGFVGKCEAIDDTVDVFAGKVVITLHSDKNIIRAICAEIDKKYEAPDELAEWL